MADLDLFRNRWAAGMCIVSLSIVITLTLAPFNFDFNGDAAFLETASRFRHRSSLDDWIANILLYVPFGFSLAVWLCSRRMGKITQLIGVFLLTLSLSTIIEGLQLFLPSRVPSSTDIYANTVGGIVGLQCFRYWGYSAVFEVLASLQNLIQRKIAYLSIHYFSLILAGYVVIIFSVSVSLQTMINLSNWTPIYPLVIGSNQMAGNPWYGDIFNLFVADQAISEEEIAQTFARKSMEDTMSDSIVAAYSFVPHHNSYIDQTGRSPRLVRRGEPTLQQDETASFINTNQWLETEVPAAFINQRLSKTSQFTVSTVLATANVEQTETAPFISLSNQFNSRRNLAFAQDGKNLILMLRTSVTGEYGARPELVIPDVFTDTSFHHLIVTFSRSILSVYIDQFEQQFSFRLNPGLVLFQKLLPLEHLKNSSVIVCKVLYYTVLFLPIGIFAGLIFIFTKQNSVYRATLIVETVLLAPMLLEVLLMLKRGRDFNLDSLLLSIGITVGALAVTSILSRGSSSVLKTGLNAKP